MLRVVALFVVMVAGLVQAGCTMMCTTELRAAVHGRLMTPDGAPVFVDAVVAVHDGQEQACEVWDDTYWCAERDDGTYEVRVYLDDQRWTYWVDVDGDGCHVEPVELDLVLGTP